MAWYDDEFELEEQLKYIMAGYIAEVEMTYRHLNGLEEVACEANNWSPAGTSSTYCKFCGRDTNVCIAFPCKESARPRHTEYCSIEPQEVAPCNEPIATSSAPSADAGCVSTTSACLQVEGAFD